MTATQRLVSQRLLGSEFKKPSEVVAWLARRYFTSRGPATLKDFTWWSGLNAREARAGLESVASKLEKVVEDDKTWWRAPELHEPGTTTTAFALPGFDEFLLGYQDRSLVLDPRDANKIVPGGNGVFQPTLVLNGRVVGTWARATLVLQPFEPLTKRQRAAAEEALERYAQFTGPKAPRSRRAKSAR